MGMSTSIIGFKPPDDQWRIIVSSWKEEEIGRARAKAIFLFGSLVSPMVSSAVNGHQSFFVAPDGSKENWPESDEYDRARDAFLGYLDTRRYGDGTSPLKWVCVQYGDDEHKTKVDAHSEESARRRKGGEL